MQMTQQHKDAMAQGRTERAIVKRYLESLEKVQRNNSAQIARKLMDVKTMLNDNSLTPVKRLNLTQKKIDLTKKLNEQDKPMTQDLEKDFVRVAKSFSERKGISYKAWREVGVPARVLKLADIHR